MFKKKNRSAFANFLRARYERATCATVVHSLPYYIALDPSTICQLKCPSCPTGVENYMRTQGEERKYRDRSIMDERLFDALIGELGEYLFMVLFYNWGEPLLNKKLPSFIRKAESYDIFTEIHTNLSLKLKDEFISEVLGSGIDQVAASIDGFTQESYGTYRRGGDLELAKKNIVRFAELRDRLGLGTRIIWNYLLFSFNEHEVEQARKFCADHGLEFNPRDAFIDNPDWLPSHRAAERESLVRESENPAANTARTKPDTGRNCAWLYGYSVVNSDGSVSPCCAPWEQDTDFGRVVPGEVAFADVWNNPNYRKSRGVMCGKDTPELSGITPICQRCPFGPVKEQYSSFDKEVIACYHNELEGKDPALDKAFDVLERESAFVEYFARNLSGITASVLPDDGTKVDILKRELESVYASKSWRITYPLRYISAKLKGRKPRK